MTAKEVIPIQLISIRTVLHHIQMEHKKGKNEPEPKVGDQDVATQ